MLPVERAGAQGDLIRAVEKGERDAERAAIDARRNRLVRGAARSGYAASAVLRVLIGLFALLLAAHAHGPHADSSGVFGVFLRIPGGTVLLLVLTAGEYALGLWLLLAGALHHDRRAIERWRKRSVDWGRALVYLGIGTVAARFVLGVERQSSAADRKASTQLLAVPGGAVVLGLIGAVIVICGLSLVWIGLWRRFRRTLHLPDDRGARVAVVVLGAVGHSVQGATIAVAGASVVVAACTVDPSRSAGLNAVLGAFADEPLGRAALVVVGVGWIAAGLYAAVRARIARL